MKDVEYRGYTIKRSRVETARRGFTEYEVTCEDGRKVYVERLWAAKEIIDGLIQGKDLETIRSDLRWDKINSWVAQPANTTA